MIRSSRRRDDPPTSDPVASWKDRAREQAILGDILMHPDTFGDYATLGLATCDFQCEPHAQIWATMSELVEDGFAPGALEVAHRLQDRGDLDRVGRPYLASLVEGVPRLSAEYRRDLFEHLRARALCVQLFYQQQRSVAELVADPLAVLNGSLDRYHAQLEALRLSRPDANGQGARFVDDLLDAVDVAAQGQAIEAAGISYTLDGIIPAYGMLGFLVAFAKVGKTTFGQQLAAHVAMGRPFLERATQRTRVLALPAEDPPEYTAWLARHLSVDCGWLTFRCAPMVLDADALTRICGTVKEGHYGLVLISSWQAVARGLIRDENDNAGSVQLVEAVKAAARASGVPWLIDAHSGKGEDQADAADPSKAMRGASAAAGAADFTLSLRYGNGTFGPQRRLSGKGRFVSFGPLVLDFDSATGAYAVVGESQAVHRETTWQEICLMGALSTEPRSVTEIAKRLGLEKVSGAARRRILSALQDRPTVGRVEMMRRGQKTVLYRLLETP